MTDSTRRIGAVLVLVTVLAPMTLLRFSLIGVAELAMMLLFLHQAVKGVRPGLLGRFPLTAFWVLFLLVSIVGALANALLLDRPTGTLWGLTFDLSAYVFAAMACFALERLSTHEGLDAFWLARNVFFAASITMSVLFALSFVTPTLFGLPLLYHGRFVPLAENLHQISMFLVPLPFLGLLVMRRERGMTVRVLALVLVVLTAVMAERTGSTKADMAIPISAGVLAWAYSLRAAGPRYLVPVNIVYVTLAAMVALRLRFLDAALAFFVANDNHGARGLLYREGFATGLQSFLVGRGPGQHLEIVRGSFSDAHQTVLTVYLQAGVLGLIALVWLGVRLLRRAWAEPELLAALAAVTVYAMGGDILRRLPAWIILFMIAHYPVRAAVAVPVARRAPAHTRVPRSGGVGGWGGPAVGSGGPTRGQA